MGPQQTISLPAAEEGSRKQTKEPLAALLDSAPHAVVATDTEGVVTMWNPAAERIFGWTAQEALGARLPFVQAEKQVEFRAMLARAVRGESFTEPGLHRRRADGSPITIRAAVLPLRKEDGTIRGILSVLSDTSDPDPAAGDEESLRRTARAVQAALEPA